MAAPFQNATAKQLRISFVWLVGAVLTLIWATIDWLAPDVEIPGFWISAVTALFMGLALFWDVRRQAEGDEIVNPGRNQDG